MLSDMVWRGAFHRHIMTIGGTRATPARTAQLDSVFTFPETPAINTAEIQTVAITALSDTSCMFTRVHAGAEPPLFPNAHIATAFRPCPPQGPYCCRRSGTRHAFPHFEPVHKRTDRRREEMSRLPYAEKGPGYGGNRMLFIVGLVIASIAVVIIPKMRVLGRVNRAPLGWMSEQWLAEHRASHSR